MGECIAVYVFKLTTNWHTMSNSAGRNIVLLTQLTNIMGSGLAFHCRVSSQNDFGVLPLGNLFFENIQTNFGRADTINGRKVPHQYKVSAFVRHGLFDGHYVLWALHYAKLLTVAALGMLTDFAQLILRKITALFAMTDMLHGVVQGRAERSAAFTVTLK